jgi:hypothetical protein
VRQVLVQRPRPRPVDRIHAIHHRQENRMSAVLGCLIIAAATLTGYWLGTRFNRY